MYRRTDMHLHTHKHACMHGFTYIHIFEHLFTCIHTHVHNMLKWMIQGYPHFRKPPYIYIFIYSIYIYIFIQYIYIYSIYIYFFFPLDFYNALLVNLVRRGAQRSWSSNTWAAARSGLPGWRMVFLGGPSGNFTVCHGIWQFLIGKSSN